MNRFLSAVLLSFVLSTSSAWMAKPVIVEKIMRDAASVGFAASIASVVLLGGPNAATAIDFTGSYADPNHPGCARLISVENDNKALISGADGNPGCPGGGGRPWKLVGKVDGDKIFVDFSPKGGPKDLTGVWEAGKNPGVRFPDGNKWTLQAKP